MEEVEMIPVPEHYSLTWVFNHTASRMRLGHTDAERDWIEAGSGALFGTLTSDEMKRLAGLGFTIQAMDTEDGKGNRTGVQ